MGTPDGQNGYIFSKPQPIHPTHDTTYVQVLAPPESAGPIALFLIVQIPELVAILHETRRVLPSNKGKNMGNTPYHPVQLRNEGHNNPCILSMCFKKMQNTKKTKKKVLQIYFNRVSTHPIFNEKKTRFAKQKNSRRLGALSATIQFFSTGLRAVR